MMHQAGFMAAAVDKAAAKVTEPDPNGRGLIDDGSVAYRLGRSVARMEAALSAPTIFGRVALAQTMRDIAPDLMDLLGTAASLWSERTAPPTTVRRSTCTGSRRWWHLWRHARGLPQHDRAVRAGSRQARVCAAKEEGFLRLWSTESCTAEPAISGSGVARDPAASDLELVGHFVSTPAKAARDSGEVVGVTPAGVTTTNDWADVIDLGADCVTYFANSIGREREAIADLVPFLERGTNVVTFSGFEIAHPASAPPELREPIEAACRAGGSSCYFTGIDPGWATTDLAIASLAAANQSTAFAYSSSAGGATTPRSSSAASTSASARNLASSRCW